jgi:Glycosyl transferase family 11
MIIVKLNGGMGNQMFQYAAGRRLAHVHNTDLKLDLGWFHDIPQNETPRKYELAAFNVSATAASAGEIARFRETALSVRLRRILPISLPFFKRRHIYEAHFHFDADILNLPDNVYLEGYWQCPGFFADIKDVVRKEFTVRTEAVAENQQMAEEIAQRESVSIHVRRGDYVSNSVTRAGFGICPPQYYRAATEIIAARTGRPHFFVFSDDPRWVKENLSFVSPATFVDLNGPDKAYEDMRLMSLCKHHIIANSSFSWWGAWLSNNPDKIVIAPRQWFRNSETKTDDLLPKEWIRI